MKRQVEVFTANCPVCDPVVKMIQELACNKCEITTYDLVKQCDNKTCLDKIDTMLNTCLCTVQQILC